MEISLGLSIPFVQNVISCSEVMLMLKAVYECIRNHFRLVLQCCNIKSNQTDLTSFLQNHPDIKLIFLSWVWWQKTAKITPGLWLARLKVKHELISVSFHCRSRSVIGPSLIYWAYGDSDIYSAEDECNRTIHSPINNSPYSEAGY